MMHAIKPKYQSVRRADPRPSKDSPNCNRQNRAQSFFQADVSTFKKVSVGSVEVPSALLRSMDPYKNSQIDPVEGFRIKALNLWCIQTLSGTGQSLKGRPAAQEAVNLKEPQ